MNQEKINPPIPTALTVKSNRFSFIWLLPIVAVVLGVWLTITSINQADIKIVLLLKSGDGLVEGKTSVRHQGIEIGQLAKLHLDEQGDGVVAHINMKKSTHSYLTDKTDFWIVKPEVNLSGITGLDTLVSGNYIAINIGAGQSTRKFIALENPPSLYQNKDGLRITLLAKDLGSISVGSPINYRKLQVGKVVDYKLTANNQNVAITIIIDAEHQHLVHSSTHFWNSSGIDFSASLPNINFKMDSLAALLIGGISFDSTADLNPANGVTNDQVFPLFEDYNSAQTGITAFIELENADGLKVGHTTIQYLGLEVAKIVSIKPKSDFSGVIAEATFNPLAGEVLNQSTRIWLVKPEIGLSGITGISTLLSGSHFEIDFQPGQPTKRHFIALDKAPQLDTTSAGRHIILKTENLGSLTRGSEIYYRRIAIGQVQDYGLSRNQKNLLINVHIKPQYSHFITSNTRFYHNSGLNISGGLNGFSVNTESLLTLIKGGISIDNSNTGRAIKNGKVFSLYKDKTAATDQGRAIQISFVSGKDISVNTKLKYQGVEVGHVSAVNLSSDLNKVLVDVKLKPGMVNIARAGTKFWVARAELGLTQANNLGALISGAFIEVEPGGGSFIKQFNGLNKAPTTASSQVTKLRVLLNSPNLGSIKIDTPVFYRQIKVGKVSGFKLANNARSVEVSVDIDQPYIELVRDNSVFWNSSGFDFDWGLFKGAKVRTDSIESILAGGISLATPESKPMGTRVTSGHKFKLAVEAKDVWLEWSPNIPIAVE